jgi:hypothetical protein
VEEGKKFNKLVVAGRENSLVRVLLFPISSQSRKKQWKMERAAFYY